MLLKLWTYIKCTIKSLLALLFLVAIIAYFFPTAGLVVFGLGILGMFSAVKEDFEKEYKIALEKQEIKRIQKIAEQSKDEFDGFEQAMALTRRAMR